MEFKLPVYVNEVLEKISLMGFESYIVGGSVRDYIIGREPSDFDITTNARPDDVKKIFSDYKTVLVGENFGTVLVIYKGYPIEITTYRLESDYKDGRKPSYVKYSNDLEDDLMRRDFTINAMAYNSNELVDLYGGVDDIKKRLIKTVGNPDERFKEDGLRILRAIRFATQLNFKIDSETNRSIYYNIERLKLISNDRIRDELFKILLAKKPSDGIELLRINKILAMMLPEVNDTVDFKQNNPYHDKDVYKHTLAVLDEVECKIELRLAALFHDVGKIKTYSVDDNNIGHFYNHEQVSCEMAYERMKKLNISNKIIEKTLILIGAHMYNIESMEEKGIRRLIYKVGEDNIMDLYNLNVADKKGTYKDRDISLLLAKKSMIEKELNKENIYNKNKLEITGYDIINLGVKEGKDIGNIIDYLMDIVIDEPSVNNRESLIELAKNKISDMRGN